MASLRRIRQTADENPYEPGHVVRKNKNDAQQTNLCRITHSILQKYDEPGKMVGAVPYDLGQAEVNKKRGAQLKSLLDYSLSVSCFLCGGGGRTRIWQFVWCAAQGQVEGPFKISASALNKLDPSES